MSLLRPRRSTLVSTVAILAMSACSTLVLAQQDGAKPAAPAAPDAAKPKSIPATGMGGGGARPAKPKPPVVITGDGKAETTLTMDVRKYDFAGTKAARRKYMPSMVKLSADKPESVMKEPTYIGKPLYSTLTIGNGTPSRFALVIDQGDEKSAKIYLDLNGDGDLTNDGTGAWDTQTEGKDNGIMNYQGTWTFKPAWKTPEGGNTVGEYALNFYWSAGRESMGMYTASVRTGKIKFGENEYDVQILESDCDGLYNKIADPNKPRVVGEPISKPVYMEINGENVDIRGTFSFGDMNYLATVSDDGSKLSMAPTMKTIKIPQITDSVPMRPAGGPAPDFEALAWKPGSTAVDPNARFNLADFKGKKIVVLDMWATWCGPCMKGIPHLSEIAEKTKDQDVVVIALNTFDDETAYVKFASGKGKDYKFMLARDPAGRDSSHAIARTLYGVTGIPATYIIDKDGKITASISGYSEGSTKVEDALKDLGVKFE